MNSLKQTQWNLIGRYALIMAAVLGAAKHGYAASCDNVPHSDHPHAMLSNGDVKMFVFLPDAHEGYYRSSRFDWAGVVGCAAYQGHTYWGEWNSEYDPLLNDSITGPVEEFRPAEGAQGFDAAKSPDGVFVKIGVGTLRRDTADAYKFGHFYPIVDNGAWKIQTRPRSIRFQQILHAPNGIAYKYEKVLALDRHGSTVTLHHTLKNLGKSPLVTEVYDHDFFMLDGQPTGPGMEVRFAFTPHPDEPFEPLAAIEGKSLVYKQELQPKQTAAAYLTGYSSSASDYAIHVEDTTHHFGVDQSGDLPIAKFYLWSIRTTISPEAYLHLDVAPGKTATWNLHYHLFASGAVEK